MPRHKTKVEGEAPKVETIKLPTIPVIICGHEEVVHSPICKECHSLKRMCGLRWNRCGAHGEHVESDCKTLCV